MIVFLFATIIGIYSLFIRKGQQFLGAFFFFLLTLFPIMVYITDKLYFQYCGQYLALWAIIAFITVLIRSKPPIALKSIELLLVNIVIILLLFIIASFLTDNSIFSYLRYFQNHFWPFLVFIVLITSPKDLNVGKILLIIVCLQILLSVAQYFGSESFNRIFRYTTYVKNGEERLLSSDSLNSASRLIVGTLSKVTRLGNFLSLTLVFLLGRKIVAGMRFTLLDYILLFSGLAVIILTGVRASLGSCLLGLLMAVIIQTNNNKKQLYILCGVIAAGFTLPIIIEYGNQILALGRVSYENPFHRAISMFGTLSNIGSLDRSNAYTLFRSMYIVDFINFDTFWFGNGIYLKNPLGYGWGIVSITDAMLLFTISEFGVFIFLATLMPYFIALYFIHKYCNVYAFRIFVILFVVLLIQTIVDSGVYDVLSSYSFFILAAGAINRRVSIFRRVATINYK